MYRGLIDNLTFVYSFICKGRGRLTAQEMEAIAKGAHTVTATAPAVLGGLDDGTATTEDQKDLQEAIKIDQHIDEMYTFLTAMEIC